MPHHAAISSTMTFFKLVQPSNACSPILVTELEMATEVRPLQRLNAASPMLVTELGMLTKVRPKQPKHLQLVVCQPILSKTVEK